MCTVFLQNSPLSLVWRFQRYTIMHLSPLRIENNFIFSFFFFPLLLLSILAQIYPSSFPFLPPKVRRGTYPSGLKSGVLRRSYRKEKSCGLIQMLIYINSRHFYINVQEKILNMLYYLTKYIRALFNLPRIRRHAALDVSEMQQGAMMKRELV